MVRTNEGVPSVSLAFKGNGMTNGDRPCVRCRLIYIPTEDRSGLFLLILAVGIIFSWVVAYVLVLALLTIIVRPTGDPPMWIYLSAVLGGLVGLVGWVLFYEPRPRRLAYQKRANRDGRLAKVVERKDSILRVPHRHIECVLRKKRVRPKDVFRVLSQLQPRELIVVQEMNGPRVVPRPCNHLFEPIEIGHDIESSSMFKELSNSLKASQTTDDKGQNRIKISFLRSVASPPPMLVTALLFIWMTFFLFGGLTESVEHLVMVLAVVSAPVVNWLVRPFPRVSMVADSRGSGIS